MVRQMLKRGVLPLMLLLPASAAWASPEAIAALRIHCKSGSDATILLSERPLVTFAGNDLVVTTPTDVVCYPSDEVVKFTYVGADEIAGMASAGWAGIVFSFGDGCLTVANLSAGAAVSVYMPDGRLLSSATADAHGRATLTLPETAGGVYVVKTPTVAFKLRKP